MSHGHLSKVERGEEGRIVTSEILAAYEKVTGVVFADLAKELDTPQLQLSDPAGTPKARRLAAIRRRTFNAALGAINQGGQLGENPKRLFTGPYQPSTVIGDDPADVEQLDQLADLLTRLDLQFGGALACQQGWNILHWVSRAPGQSNSFGPQLRPLAAVLAKITARTAWSLADTNQHDLARSLRPMALWYAVQANDHNLRAQVIIEGAAHHNAVGYHDDALDLLRMVAGDERVAPTVMAVLHATKARVLACQADETQLCRAQVTAAERVADRADPTAPGWGGSMGAAPGLLQATLAHAVADLASLTGRDDDLTEARNRLSGALDMLDPATHGRSYGLCAAKLATTHLAAGNLDEAAHIGYVAVAATATVTSARLTQALHMLRTAAQPHATNARVRDLLDSIEAELS